MLDPNSDPPGDRILDWTIVVSPDDDRLACSPDGLCVEHHVGYEFKTKDCVKVPAKAEDILDCEYLQCQTCLSFCRDFVWAWILCYNRLDTGEFKAYLVVLDEGLWEDFMAPNVVEFVDKCVDTAGLLYQRVAAGPPQGVDYEQFLESHKYKPFVKGVKSSRQERVCASKRSHVFPIKFV